MKAFIKAISYYLPKTVYTNDDFFREFPEAETNRSKLARIGVSERRLVEPNEIGTDIGEKCGLEFFEEHNVDPQEIDFLIFCTLDQDYYTPNAASVMHKKLSLKKDCGCIDYNLGCSGYIYGLAMAKAMLETHQLKNVLLITTSTLTKKLHPKDKSSRYLFGDAAAATLISARAGEGIGQFVLGTNGEGYDKIIVRDGGYRSPYTDRSFADYTDEYGNVTNNASFFMNGTSIFIFGLSTVPKIVNEVLRKEQKMLNDIDLFIFHQANIFLIESISKKLSIPQSKVFNYMDKVGNTVSSSIPIALYEAMKAGKAERGDKIMMVGFGVGLSWGGTIVTL